MRPWFGVVAFGLSATALAAQSGSAELLATARASIAARQWDSADLALSEALERAPYIMDSSWVYVWRGVLEYQLGRHQLARLSFRRALNLYPDPGVRGLDTISAGLAAFFDREFRAVRTFSTWDLDQPARWTTRPELVMPPALHRARGAGEAVVRMVVDTAGRVEERSIEVLMVPDSVLAEPVKRMIARVAFTPARIAGKPVRSVVACKITLAPPRRDPLRLIELARIELRARRPDSALTLLEEAVESRSAATPALRVYAALVEGMAWHSKGDRTRAAGAFDSALDRYAQLRAQGTDFAPFLRRLADSLRLTARRE
jgi:tetratricopeptide (TPR) repeat protein